MAKARSSASSLCLAHDAIITPNPAQTTYDARQKMTTRLLVVASFGVLILTTVSCGGGNSSNSSGSNNGNGGGGNPVSSISVTVTPTSAAVLAGQTVLLSATVSGSSNQSVAWAVTGIAGGNATVGTISSAGVYTAPGIPPTPNTVTITATSIVDSSKSASAQIVVNQNVSVTIAPNVASMIVTKTQQFTATVSGATNQNVTWSVFGILEGDAVTGTITTSGVYTAPAIAPSVPVPITATSVADSTKSATAYVTVANPLPPPGEWSRTPPYGGNGLSLAVDPNAINNVYFGASNAGVFKSTDHGNNWNILLQPSANQPVLGNPVSIAVGRGSTLYILFQGPQNLLLLYSSTDGGNTFQIQTLPTTLPGSSLSIDPQQDRTIYAYGYTGVYKSTDGGATWSSLSAPAAVTSLLIDPTASNTVYAATGGSGFFASDDGGQTWLPSNSGISNGSLFLWDVEFDPSNPARIFASASCPSCGSSGTNDLYVTTDKGQHWKNMTSGEATWPNLQVLKLQISPEVTTTIYLSTQNFDGTGIYKSVDGGATWSASGTSNQIGSPLFVLSPGTPDILMLGGNDVYGFQSTADGGATWTASVNGMTALNGAAVSVDPSTPTTIYFLLGTEVGGGLLKSTDSGGTWALLLHEAVSSFAIDPSDSNHILASFGIGGAGLKQTTDGGLTWAVLSTPLGLFDRVRRLTFGPRGSGLVFGCTPTAGIIRSVDNGNTWYFANSGISVADCLSVSTSTQNASEVFAGMTDNDQQPTGGTMGIYKSTDGGASWVNVKTNLLGGGATVAVDPVDDSSIYADDGNWLYKSADGGLTWTWNPVKAGDGALPRFAIDSRLNSTIYLSNNFYGGQVWVSTDAGFTWANVTNGLGWTYINDIAVVPGTTNLFVATRNNGLLAFH